MEALSDDILLSIFEMASQGKGHHMMRMLLPLVCKRWMDTIYSAKGNFEYYWAVAFSSRNLTEREHPKGVAGCTGNSLFRHITLDYSREHCFAFGRWQPADGRSPPSISAVAQWIHRNIERGNIEYLVHFRATDGFSKWAKPEKVRNR